MRVLCVICLILAVLRIYTRQERIKRNAEQIEKEHSSPAVSKGMFYDKYIDAYVEQKFGADAVWTIKAPRFVWSEALCVPLHVIKDSSSEDIKVSKNEILFVYNDLLDPKKPEPEPEKPEKENVVNKWIYSNLPEINIQIYELLQTNTTRIKYPCDLEFKYLHELLKKLCECTEYDFRLQGNMLVIDFEVYKLTCCGNAG